LTFDEPELPSSSHLAQPGLKTNGGNNFVQSAPLEQKDGNDYKQSPPSIETLDSRPTTHPSANKDEPTEQLTSAGRHFHPIILELPVPTHLRST
jgi:hypothetical protein